MHGLGTEWHSNGQKKFEINVVDGKRHGILIEWDKDGKKVAETKFENGVKVE